MSKKRFFILIILLFIMIFQTSKQNNISVNANENNTTYENNTFIHSAGRTSTLLLSNEGVVYGWGLWGDNKEITLSKKLVSPTDISKEIKLDDNDKIINVFSGEQHCFILTLYGRVFAMGSGENNQFGYSDYLFKSKPTEITSLFSLNIGEIITLISCGDDFNVALTNKNRVISFGKNIDGQLGVSSNEKNQLTYDITSKFILQENDYIVDVSCGASHTLALSKNGYVYCFGSNKFGQLGIQGREIIDSPTRLENISETIIKIETGRFTSYVLTNQSQLYGFGSNSHGQLATCDAILSSNKKDTPYLMNIGFKFEHDEYIKDIIAGYYFAIVKTNLNNYYSFGENSSGQLANLSTLSTSFPQKIEYKSLLSSIDEIENISCGEQHCVATTKYGHILAWGSNLQSQLGEDNSISIVNNKIIDITYNFPPIIVISTNTASIKYKEYVLDISAFYLDNEKITETYYCVSNSTTTPFGNWVQFNNSVILKDYEGEIYLHLKIDSKKETYYHVSKMYKLDHTSPKLSLYDKNNEVFNNKFSNSTILVKATDDNNNVEIVYTYNGKQYSTSQDTFTFISDGTYLVTAVDEAKNSSATIEFTIDTILPTITKIDDNLIKSSSIVTKEKKLTIHASENLICYQLNDNDSNNNYIALDEKSNTFEIKLKKGENTLTIFDLAGNQSLTYEIIYSPRFFQDTQLLLIIFGTLSSIFIILIIVIYTIRNKKRLIK